MLKDTISQGLNSRVTPLETQQKAIEGFLIATREGAAFRTIRDEFSSFDLAKVEGATDVQILVWEMRVQFDYAAIQAGKSLDEFVAAQLENAPSKSAKAARVWLLDATGGQFSPRKSVKVARDFVAQAEPPLEFSTDSELDGQLGSIEWLWENYIPRGFVTALVAEQDAGKSTVAQNFCQTILDGGRWPDGQTCKIKADKLLWIDTDGNLPLFHARLKSWRMPRGRFIFPADTLQELTIDSPENWRWIERVIEKFRPPLIVLDALSGSHNGKENDTDSMKAVMKRLHNLAQKHKIAIIVIHHLNKAPSGVFAYPLTIDRLRGSSSISQFCRSILALTTPDPARPNERRLDVMKLNLAQKPGAVGYALGDNGPQWGTAPEPPKPMTKADEAADWLRDFLGDAVKPAKEVEESAEAAGIGQSALKSARKILGVETKREGGANGKFFLSLNFQKSAENEISPRVS